MTRFFFVILLLCSPLVESKTTPMVYRYWDLGVSQNRDQYQFELLRMALEKTRATHGDYELVRADKKIGSLRASREVSRGDLINIEATPNWTTEQVPSELRHDKRIAVKIPLLHDLLGYRRLVIRKSDVRKFAAISQSSELQALVAGQGKDWEDAFIYRANGYKVNAAADYPNLFSMLVAGRFDYIPLSVIEVDSLITQFGKHSFDITIAPNILIYYPFPVLFQVSINQPELAERVEKGLMHAKQDGSMDRLFESYFSADLAELRASKNRVFILENKRVPEELRMVKPGLLQ
jgi:ABC-type amino acid transport substrate-binding protein